MARDPLKILLAIRQRAVEQARQVLAACQSEEAEIAGRIGLLEDAARRDRAEVGPWEERLQFVDMAARRRVAEQEERLALATELAAAEDRSAEARGELTAARTAAEAVAQLAADRAAAARVEADKREQHVLDDITRARRGRRLADKPLERSATAPRPE